MNPSTTFLTMHPQGIDWSGSAANPKWHGRLSRGLKHLQLRSGLAIVAALWLASLITGSFFLTRYADTPGSDGPAPSKWPSGVSVPRDLNLPTLVMFLHPYCPCSRASVGELALIMAHRHGRVAGVVVIAANEGLDDPLRSGLARDAALIPGVTVLCDQDGNAARRFHIATSGGVVLYDKNESLLFDGGITSARAHSGDNDGRDAVEALVAGKESITRTTPTYGCPIFNVEPCASTPKCRANLTPLVSLPK